MSRARNFRSDITIDPSRMTPARIASPSVSLTEAIAAFERRIAKSKKCCVRRAILMRTMARAALVDNEQGVGVKVAVGFAMSCPSRSGCLALGVAQEAALACPAGKIISLDAIWIVLRSRRGSAGCKHGCGRRESKKYDTHFSLLRC
jgi:hypothetical protein